MSEHRPQNFTDLRQQRQPVQQVSNAVKRRAPRFVRSNLKTLLIAIVAVVFVVLAYGYVHTKNQLNHLSNPQTASKDATQQVVDKVSKLVELPTGETPTLATVNDATKLKGQAFFDPAQNGDKVLIYSKSSWAVLYRPSSNKVIEYSKINLNSQ